MCDKSWNTDKLKWNMCIYIIKLQLIIADSIFSKAPAHVCGMQPLQPCRQTSISKQSRSQRGRILICCELFLFFFFYLKQHLKLSLTNSSSLVEQLLKRALSVIWGWKLGNGLEIGTAEDAVLEKEEIKVKWDHACQENV